MYQFFMSQKLSETCAIRALPNGRKIILYVSICGEQNFADAVETDLDSFNT